MVAPRSPQSRREDNVADFCQGNLSDIAKILQNLLGGFKHLSLNTLD
jgi:hypothetical protein